MFWIPSYLGEKAAEAKYRLAEEFQAIFWYLSRFLLVIGRPELSAPSPQQQLPRFFAYRKYKRKINNNFLWKISQQSLVLFDTKLILNQNATPYIGKHCKWRISKLFVAHIKLCELIGVN